MINRRAVIVRPTVLWWFGKCCILALAGGDLWASVQLSWCYAAQETILSRKATSSKSHTASSFA